MYLYILRTETTKSIFDDIGFESPLKFYDDVIVESNDYNVLTKTKTLVLKSEEMIQSWMYTFQRVS